MKEKANELVRKFETAIVEELLGGDKLYKYTAKQCALIAVDEIMKEVDDNPTTNQNEYWNYVKDEINKL